MASPSADDLDDGAPFPTRRLWGTVEVPDFRQIPRERWADAMRTIPQRLRMPSVQGVAVGSMEHVVELSELAMSDLPPARSDLARAEVKARPRMAPTPAADHFRRASRQVNFRLTEEEYVDLATAAQLIGTSPTQLAGMLTRNGVQRVIAEANRPDG